MYLRTLFPAIIYIKDDLVVGKQFKFILWQLLIVYIGFFDKTLLQ